MFRCRKCDKVLRETDHQFFQRYLEHKRGEDDRNITSLYAKHFIEEEHRFVKPIKHYKI